MKIKMFITDIDGCLTDGKYIVHPGLTGYGRCFNTRDFLGMELLYQANIHVVVLTAAKDPTWQQFERAGKYIEVITGVRDKKEHIQHNFVDTGKYQWREIAFIGDDLNDMELLMAAGLSACPKDAPVLDAVEMDVIVLDRKGGDGAVREFTDLVRKIEGIPARWKP